MDTDEPLIETLEKINGTLTRLDERLLSVEQSYAAIDRRIADQSRRLEAVGVDARAGTSAVEALRDDILGRLDPINQKLDLLLKGDGG